MNRVAIDIDEVLTKFLVPMARFHKQKIIKPKYSYVYREIFDIDEPASQKMVKEFYQSKSFTELTPIYGSQSAMFNLRQRFKKMYIVTGRQNMAREETERWIDTYFPYMFDDVILTNSYTPNEIPKVDICRALNIDLIIDDNKAICDTCIENGVRALNFIGGDDEIYPWCEESDISIQGWVNVNRNGNFKKMNY
jgi:5'(3')-deoxyribonucleotidase|tara:strand:- start:81 stop:662 length:582 start_codon:yes stop_codon:yes gene_type:complete